jgi:hypothetical protein
LESLALEDVGIFKSIWYISQQIWYILRPFVTFYGYLVHFSRFGTLQQDKSGNPGRWRHNAEEFIWRREIKSTL